MTDLKDRADTDGLKEAVVDALFVAWTKCPQMRLGQLLVNALANKQHGGSDPSLFVVEDFELLRRVEAFAKGTKP